MLLSADFSKLLGNSSDVDYGSFTTAGLLTILSPESIEANITEYNGYLDLDLGIGLDLGLVNTSWTEHGARVNR